MSRDVQPRFKTGKAAPKRRAPNSTLPAATQPIAPMSEYRKTELEDYDTLIDALKERAGGRCEMGDYGPHAPGCNGFGQDPHHILPRSLGGEHSLDNLAFLSRRCHDWSEEHPVGAKTAGVSEGLHK